MRPQFITWIESMVAIAGLVILAFLGTMVTPKGIPSRPLAIVPPLSPSELIDDARSGYQVDACVRDISPRSVLSDSMSGEPQLIVLAGAPVTECFPNLAEFAAQMREENAKEERETPSVEGRAFGTDVRTSVQVLPTPDTPAETPSVVRASDSVPVIASTTEATSTVGMDPQDPQPFQVSLPPSGGYSTGGASAGVPVEIPPVDVFDACMKEIFGQVVPSDPSPQSISAFEACLVR